MPRRSRGHLGRLRSEIGTVTAHGQGAAYILGLGSVRVQSTLNKLLWKPSH